MEKHKFLEKEINHLESQLDSVNQEPFPITGFDKTKLILPISILIAAVLISGALIYTRNSSTSKNLGGAAIGKNLGPNPKIDVSADDDPFIGNENAKVTMIEFSDFECPFCRKFWKETLPQIKKEYIDTGKVKFVYRDFPLDFHPGAKPAAEGAECAEDQGKFWELHDKIFREQDKQGQGTIQFGKTDVVKWAGQIGLNMAQFNQCLDSEKYNSEVEKDFADGNAAGVSGTPTIFINGRTIIGAQPFEVFRTLIEEELKR